MVVRPGDARPSWTYDLSPENRFRPPLSADEWNINNQFHLILRLDEVSEAGDSNRKLRAAMKRGTKCVAQTINLSNPETCVRPKRIQKLVHADMMQPCPSIVAGGSSYWTPRPVPIKICTRKDMQRTCPPKLCECPQKTSPKTSGYKFCNILLFLVKSSIAAGLVYWTHTEGLWGSSADVEDLYRRIMATIAPTLGDRELIELPRINDFKNTMIRKYNYALFTIMNCIVSASTMLRKQLQRMLVDVEPAKVEPSGAESFNDTTDTEEES